MGVSKVDRSIFRSLCQYASSSCNGRMVNTELNWRRLGFMALLADGDGLSGSGLLTLWIVVGGGIVRGSSSMLGALLNTSVARCTVWSWSPHRRALYSCEPAQTTDDAPFQHPSWAVKHNSEESFLEHGGQIIWKIVPTKTSSMDLTGTLKLINVLVTMKACES